MNQKYTEERYRHLEQAAYVRRLEGAIRDIIEIGEQSDEAMIDFENKLIPQILAKAEGVIEVITECRIVQDKKPERQTLWDFLEATHMLGPVDFVLSFSEYLEKRGK